MMGICRFCRQGAIVKDAVGPICPDCIEEGYAESNDDNPVADKIETTPKRIWAWECDPAWKTAWDVDDAEAPPHAKQYHRADLSANLVRAAYRAGLEAAAQYVEHQSDAKTIRTLSADREAVAAIVAQVMEKE